MKKYLTRIADKMLTEALESSGAVLIEGPKWCGKTRTASEISKSILYMQDPDSRDSNLQVAGIKPSLLLKGEVPRLIDEWQVASVLWDAVRHEIDLRGKDGQFILTGSAVPIMDKLISHTGTGRITRIKMRPMSLYESRESNGQVSLKEIFQESSNCESISTLEIEMIAKVIVRGGWPSAVTAKSGLSERRAQDYVNSIINVDASRVDGIEKNPNKMLALMKSISRNISTEASYSTLIKDMEGGEKESISRPTIQSYINSLQRIFVVEDLEAWNPSIRSSTSLRVTPKRHFIDPSIATASLGINDVGLLNDFNTFGYLFESLCIRDLRIYTESLGGRLFHYRDKLGLECDAVIVLRNGLWGAVEIRLGSNMLDQAAQNLKKLSERIDSEKMKKPSFLMILIGSKLGYKREDGILVVPIGCLKN